MIYHRAPSFHNHRFLFGAGMGVHRVFILVPRNSTDLIAPYGSCDAACGYHKHPAPHADTRFRDGIKRNSVVPIIYPDIHEKASHVCHATSREIRIGMSLVRFSLRAVKSGQTIVGHHIDRYGAPIRPHAPALWNLPPLCDDSPCGNWR